MLITGAPLTARKTDLRLHAPDAFRYRGSLEEWIDAGLKNLTLKAKDVDSSGDLAYEIGEFTLQAPVKGGNPTTATGNYVVVWKRGGDGVWRLKVDTWNETAQPTKAQSTSGG
jgi:ketosteroid isomerase-like protein